jgi:hypothetical protein
MLDEYLLKQWHGCVECFKMPCTEGGNTKQQAIEHALVMLCKNKTTHPSFRLLLGKMIVSRLQTEARHNESKTD